MGELAMNMKLKNAVDNFDEIFSKMTDEEFFAEFIKLGMTLETVDSTSNISGKESSSHISYDNCIELLRCA